MTTTRSDTQDLQNQLHHYQVLLNNIDYWRNYGYVEENIIVIINELKNKLT